MCLFLVMIAAERDWPDTEGGQKGQTLEGMSVQGTSRICLLTFTVRSQARTARLRQQQRDRQIDRQRDRAGVPRHAQPLASRGNSGDKRLMDDGGCKPPTLKQGAGPAAS